MYCEISTFIRSALVNDTHDPARLVDNRAAGHALRKLLGDLDHLNGTLYINHISPLKRDLIRRKIRKLQKTGEWK